MALDLSSTATEILNNLGKFGYVQLVQKNTTYDPVTGIQSSTDTIVDLSGVELPLPAELLNDTRIVISDKYFIIDGSITPTTADSIRVNEKDYKIVEITPTNHAGIPQIFEVIARG